jgi:hypothetical protein
VAQHLETRVPQQMADVFFAAREVVVHAQNVVSRLQQALAQVGAQEAGSAGDEDAFRVGHALSGLRFFSWNEQYAESAGRTSGRERRALREKCYES